MSVPSLSPVRKLRIFIPPKDSPLLTTYGRSLLPKLSPMKQKFHVFSNRLQFPSEECNPQTILISTRDLDAVNSVYRKIKKSRGQLIKDKQTQYIRDPLYKSLYNMKKKSMQQTTMMSSFTNYTPRRRNMNSQIMKRVQQ